jgi:hypothetical protein
VVSDESDDAERAETVTAFAREAGADEKMHLHFVDAATIRSLYEA